MAVNTPVWPFDGRHGSLGWQVLGLAAAGVCGSASFAAFAISAAKRWWLSRLHLVVICAVTLTLGVWAGRLAASEQMITSGRLSIGVAAGLALFSGWIGFLAALTQKKDPRTSVLLFAAAATILGGATAAWIWRSTLPSKYDGGVCELRAHSLDY